MGESDWKRFVEEVRGGLEAPFEEDWRAFQRAYASREPDEGPPPAWWPDERTRARSNLEAFMAARGIPSYEALHRFSVVERSEFWRGVIERLRIAFDVAPKRIADLDDVEDPRWLPGTRLNIVASCFQAGGGDVAIVSAREDEPGLEYLSYGELERSVYRFANGLRALGLGRGERVALYMPMTPECVIAYLGVVASGCAVVSIADSFSPGELAQRMTIAGSRTVVTVAGYRRGGKDVALYPKVRTALGAIEGGRAIVVGEPRLAGEDLSYEDMLRSDERRLELTEPDQVTNVLFSSGTTGEPKAIPWTQMTPLKCAMDAHFHQDVHPKDVLCWPTNIGWMMGPWLIYATLLNRATMALYEGAPVGSAFFRFVRDAGVTMLGVIPSLVRAWKGASSVARGELDEVRVFSSTGEASSREEYLWLMSRASYRAPIIEYLGGTEIGGGHLTGTVLQPASPAVFTTKALGCDFVVLDEQGEEVRPGGSGELFLIPPALGLSQRLLNKDHHEVYYRGCPRGPRGEILRRHGDEIAVLARGFFRAQGRADDTMNLGGIKVASLELERVMNEHPAVVESAAVAVQSEGEGADRLVVFAVLSDPSVERESLRRELGRAIAEKLNPLFKVEDLVAVDALPRTASNKVMRRELRARYGRD